MAKMKISRHNMKRALRLILMLCAFLSILNCVSYQDVWADTQQEPTKELAPVPAPVDVNEQDNKDETIKQDVQQESTKELDPVSMPMESIEVTSQPDGGPVVVAPRVTNGRIIPVYMAQVFFVLIIGMAGIKLVLVMAEKVGLR